MRVAEIVGLSVLAAVFYGVVHDQVTARLSLEYFTIGHPRLIASESPTVLALFWGVVATWWVGLPLGVILAFAARRGGRPKLVARQLLRPVMGLLGVLGAGAVVTAIVAGSLASAGTLRLYGELASEVPVERHARFIAAGGAHSASYFLGGIGGLVVARRTWVRRRVGARAVEQQVGADERR